MKKLLVAPWDVWDVEAEPADGYFTGSQWQEVVNSLAAVGVNADTVEVNTWLGREDLRYALRAIAKQCQADVGLRKGSPTPKRIAANMKQTRAALVKALVMLNDPYNHNYLDPTTADLVFPRAPGINDASRGLMQLIIELDKRREALLALGGSSRRSNAVKTHIKYWTELARLWRAIVPNATSQPYRRKHLRRFLHACSLPLFPGEITTKKLTAFADRALTQTRA